MEFVFKLVKEALHGGGDRYETTMAGKPFPIYFPQQISRVNGVPKKEIRITLH